MCHKVTIWTSCSDGHLSLAGGCFLIRQISGKHFSFSGLLNRNSFCQQKLDIYFKLTNVPSISRLLMTVSRAPACPALWRLRTRTPWPLCSPPGTTTDENTTERKNRKRWETPEPVAKLVSSSSVEDPPPYHLYNIFVVNAGRTVAFT